MKTLFSSILLLLATISTAQFKIPKKVDWEIANTKPILLLQLPDSDPNAQIFNSSLKYMLNNILEHQGFLNIYNQKNLIKLLEKTKKNLYLLVTNTISLVQHGLLKFI